METQRNIEINGEENPVTVTKEVYRAYKRPQWAESQRKRRAKRCRDAKGNRCTEDCKTCPKAREGSVLSLDQFSEDGYDIADPVDIAELVEGRLRLEQLVAAFDVLEPDEQSLVWALFFEGRTERDYADELCISHQAVGKRKMKILEKLHRHIAAEENM